MTYKLHWLSVASAVSLFAVAALGCGKSTSHGTASDAAVSDAGSTNTAAKDSSVPDSGTSVGLPFDAAAFQMASCDSTITSVTMCGSTACPAIMSQLAGAVCSVTCCTADGMCGTRRGYKDSPTDCRGPAVPDPSCPSMSMGTGMFGGGATSDDGGATAGGYPGCCAPSGHCGIISSIDMSCITSSALLPMLMPGAACGGNAADGGGTGDGG